MVKRAQQEGPQIVTRHGDAVVVVLDISEYQHTVQPKQSFKEFLLSMPATDDLEIERSEEPASVIDLSE